MEDGAGGSGDTAALRTGTFSNHCGCEKVKFFLEYKIKLISKSKLMTVLVK